MKEALNNPELMSEYGQTYVSDVEIAHGRIEQRTVYALPVSAIKNKVPLKDWKKDAQTVFMAVTESENKKNMRYQENQKSDCSYLHFRLIIQI